jgi:hypothetical protein
MYHARMKKLAILAGLLLSPLAIPGTALACSPVPNYRPPTQAQLEQGVREGFRRAHAVVEVVAEAGSASPRPGRMRVLRVFKGNYRVGSRLTVDTLPGSACGAGDFPTGARGIMMIHHPGGRLSWQGFIAPAHVAMLRREGLLPR